LLIVAITFSKEPGRTLLPTTMDTCSPRTAAFGRASAGHSRFSAASLRLLREAGVTRRDKTYLWAIPPAGNLSIGCWRRSRTAFEAVGAAHSGWYTLPTLYLHHPDGLGGIGLTREDVVRFLGYPLVIFSGDQDIDGTTENFPRHEAAMAQGPNRFTRAQFYIAGGTAEAAKLGVPCRWSRVVVPGVAHEGMRMSAFAAQYWFGGTGD
jgi:hypothetical protein